ncbi:MAG: carboxypeptidase-like regulatory domain-containing protein [Rhodospirillaceae bacterium]
MPRHLVWIVVVLSAAACDHASRQATPAGPSSPAAPTRSNSVWIVSGADGSPVRDAAVVIEGQAYRSDDNGQVTVAAPPGAWAIDVEAAGFLPRRTTTAVNQIIALWPVANEAEAQAVRQMVYQRGGALDGVLYPPDSGPFYITIDPAYLSDLTVSNAWRRGGTEFGATFGLQFQLSSHFQYETNEIAVNFADAGAMACAPVPGWGFCRSSPSYKQFALPPRLSADPVTIRRVLASWFLGPNPQPGLLAPDAPADTLSPLELQTIRMILQRTLKNRWPDDDRW